MTRALLQEWKASMDGLAASTVNVKLAAARRLVSQETVARMDFLEWRERDLRHTKFVALRDDIDPRALNREKPLSFWGLVDVSVPLVLHELQPAVSDLGGRQSQPERGATLSWDRRTATTNTAPVLLRYAA